MSEISDVFEFFYHNPKSSQAKICPEMIGLSKKLTLRFFRLAVGYRKEFSVPCANISRLILLIQPYWRKGDKHPDVQFARD
ncbi:hypothetical protein ACPFUG_003680 [Vibrio cholerae]